MFAFPRLYMLINSTSPPFRRYRIIHLFVYFDYKKVAGMNTSFPDCIEKNRETVYLIPAVQLFETLSVIYSSV